MPVWSGHSCPLLLATQAVFWVLHTSDMGGRMIGEINCFKKYSPNFLVEKFLPFIVTDKPLTESPVC
jgi:hypothetical protein